MNKDSIVHALVAADAQLRRLEKLSKSIGDATEHKARIPPLIEETRRYLQSVTDRVAHSESA